MHCRPLLRVLVFDSSDLHLAPKTRGALPTLFAATSPTAAAGSYYGPDKFNETRGAPASAKIPSKAGDALVAARLWNVAERLAGVTFSSIAAGVANLQ